MLLFETFLGNWIFKFHFIVYIHFGSLSRLEQGNCFWYQHYFTDWAACKIWLQRQHNGSGCWCPSQHWFAPSWWWAWGEKVFTVLVFQWKVILENRKDLPKKGMSCINDKYKSINLFTFSFVDWYSTICKLSTENIMKF